MYKSKANGQGLGRVKQGRGLANQGQGAKSSHGSGRGDKKSFVHSIFVQQKAFSLVELMIVVAIIGVLTAIAIPNFQRFQARSRQTEAKAGLTGIYTAAKAFHAKWEAFAAPFDAIGYEPGGEFRYVVGWDDGLSEGDRIAGLAAGNDLSDTGCNSGDDMLGVGPAPGRIYRGDCTTDKEWNTETYCGTHECTYVGVAAVDAKLDAASGVTTEITVNTFVAGAVGDLEGVHTAAADVASNGDSWTIDELKSLTNHQDQVENF